VSHDRYFINRIATKVIELSETGSKLYLGDYDYYVEKKLEETEIAAMQQSDVQEKAISQGKQSFFQSKEQQKAIRSLQRKVTQIEA
ncbi:multidrug ABC transporter ATP-binding protein, partial [Enterococcus faecalis]